MTKRLDIQYFLAPDEAFHLASNTFNERNKITYHSHNFAEICWITEGTGIHLINETECWLEKGNLCFIRPSDSHTFAAKPAKKGLTVFNIAFPVATLDYFKARYFNNIDDYFWSKEPYPLLYKLDDGLLAELNDKAAKLLYREKSTQQLDRFLLFIFDIVSCQQQQEGSNGMPLWLELALKKYPQQPYLQKGIQGFVELTDRNIDYVNRTLKQHTGKTLTDTVNTIRMSYAADRLRMSEENIKMICANCGFDNVGHFYKLFKQAYCISPAEYRKRHKKII